MLNKTVAEIDRRNSYIGRFVVPSVLSTTVHSAHHVLSVYFRTQVD
jgi:hypothetical protein